MTSLKFFADHCVSNYVISQLRRGGSTVLRLSDYLPADAPDNKVILKARELEAILLSLNGDFADIITYPPEKFQGIVAIQVRNHPEIIPSVMERLLQYFQKHPDMHHYNGKLFLIDSYRIRIKT